MQISDNEVKKILGQGGLVQAIDEVGEKRQRAEDQELVQSVISDVVNMGDREDRIAELKARIESGSYNPTGAEIADAMIRRAIADSIH